MNLTPKQGITPPGGWLFVTGDGVRLSSDSLDGLVEALTNYRRVNGFPIGNPREVIEDDICARYPQICTRKPNTPPPPSESSLASKVQGWIANRYARGAPALVSSREAESRAAICAKCPMNVRWSNPCKPCEVEWRRKAALLRAGSRVSNEEQLDACAVIGQCNKTAVWLDELGSRKNLPSYCWRAHGDET